MSCVRCRQCLVWRELNSLFFHNQSRYLGFRHRFCQHPLEINWFISHRYMATSGLDHQLKIFDLRGTFQPLSARTLPQGAGHLAFSQRGLLVAGMGDVVNIWAGPGKASPPTLEQPYLTHRLSGHVHGLQFCPFEDVLGVGHSGGMTSMLVPGKWVREWNSWGGPTGPVSPEWQGFCILPLQGLLSPTSMVWRITLTEAGSSARNGR